MVKKKKKKNNCTRQGILYDLWLPKVCVEQGNADFVLPLQKKKKNKARRLLICYSNYNIYFVLDII